MDPYKSGMFKQNPYHAKTDVESSLTVVLNGSYENRGLSLITQPSRCVKKHEIHELIASDEEDIKPGSTVNRIAYLGFTEITTGGVIISGDEVFFGGECIGAVAGFDETHMPNHLNIVIKCGKRLSGTDHGFELRQSVIFKQVPNN
jgi:hypothetical protein